MKSKKILKQKSNISNIQHVFVCIYFIISEKTELISIILSFFIYFINLIKTIRSILTLVFSHLLHNKNKKHEQEVNQLVKQFIGDNLKTKGFIEMNSNIYFFMIIQLKQKLSITYQIKTK